MEEELKEINKKLENIIGRREYPDSTQDMDDICDKLDQIIDLLKKAE